MRTDRNHCAICGHPMIVVVSDDKIPLCHEHFGDYLVKARNMVEKLKSLPTPASARG